MRTTPHPIAVSLLFVGLLLVGLYCYWPGLTGGFLLDDETNLFRLSMLNNEGITDPLFTYIVDGLSSQLGRPLSLLSFAAQYYSWPQAPSHFKYVNLMLHLFNAVLVFVLMRQLLNLTHNPKARDYLALCVAALWTLHPIQVSTVLYVIQRMTELSTLFVLLALISYVTGRNLIARGNTGRGYAVSTIGIVFFGLLAVLSKENGVLLLLFIIILEATVLKKLTRPRYWKLWSAIFLYLPLLLILGLFVTAWSGYQEDYAIRGFSMATRLLTEQRVLLDYLVNIFVVRPRAYGLFHDDFSLSNSLIDPLSTLGAVVVVLGLLVLAWHTQRRGNVWVAFGLFWFFAAHVLESSFIPLEIYFEHRNYLALLGPLAILVIGGYHLFLWIQSRLVRPVLAIGLVLWSGLLVLVLLQETKIWGDPLRQAQIWGKEKPNSKRAQVVMVNIHALLGQYPEATATLVRLAEIYPDDSAIYLAQFQLRCLDPNIKIHNLPEVLKRLQTAQSSFATITTLGKIILLKEQDACQHLEDSSLDQLFATLLANPKFAFQKSDLYFLQARLSLTRQHLATALNQLELSYQAYHRVMVKLYQVQVLAYVKQYASALHELKKAELHLATHTKERLIYQQDVLSWNKVLQEKLALPK